MGKQFYKLERLVSGEWLDFAWDRQNGEFVKRDYPWGTLAEMQEELADRERTLPEYTYRIRRCQ